MLGLVTEETDEICEGTENQKKNVWRYRRRRSFGSGRRKINAKQGDPQHIPAYAG